MRDALQALVPGVKGTPFAPGIRRAIVDTWSRAGEKALTDALPSRNIELAASSAFVHETEENKDKSFITELKSDAETQTAKMLEALTRSQKIAVKNAVTRCVSLVRGPPGTGKTHVAAAIAVAATEKMTKAQRVLAVTQSHAAALNLHRRLESFGVLSARIGTTLRPDEITEQHSFDAVRTWCEDSDIRLMIEYSAMRPRKSLRKIGHNPQRIVTMTMMTKMTSLQT